MTQYGTTPGERAIMSRSLALLFGAGASLVFVTLLLPHHANTDDVRVAIPPAVAYVVTIALVRFDSVFSATALQAILFLGTVLVTGCVVWGGDSASAYPYMYVWVALYAAYFFDARIAALEIALVAACCAAGFAMQDDTPVGTVHWVMAVGTVAVGGALIARLTRAIREQASDLTAVAKMAAGLSDVAGFAQQTCQGLQRSTRAGVVIILEPLPDEGGMRVSAMAGAAEAGLAFSGEKARQAMERCYRDAEGQELHADAPRRRLLEGDVLGWAQPVLRDGRVAAVLGVAWTTNRRAIAERVRTAALLFAAEASVAMDRVERQKADRERRALEINDNIVQGLVVAKYSSQRGDPDATVAAIDDTLVRARALISEQLQWVGEQSGLGIQPGDLARQFAGEVSVGSPDDSEPPPAAPSAG